MVVLSKGEVSFKACDPMLRILYLNETSSGGRAVSAGAESLLCALFLSVSDFVSHEFKDIQ